MNKSDIYALTVRSAGVNCPCWNVLLKDLDDTDDDYNYFHIQAHAELFLDLEGINGFQL